MRVRFQAVYSIVMHKKGGSMLLKPTVLHEGVKAKLVLNGKQIGTIGHWKVCTFGDDRPYLTASGCAIPSVWHSAGHVSVVGRPSSRTRAKEMIIKGEVKRIGRDVLSLGNIEIEGAD
jgi:hypothetical protein